MAKALWEQPITKNDDWGGGEFSHNAPVSGKYVQQFIKETLNKKFGYLYYNRENNQNKYLVFADKDDYNKWYSDPAKNAELVLATFDAPAPATIKTKTLQHESPESVIARFGADITPIVFHYYIEDNSGNAVAEDVIMRITATSKSSVKSEVITIPYDLKTYKKQEKDYHNEYPESLDYLESNDIIGTRYEYTRLNRLLTTADKYNIVITLTGATTQVSTTLAFQYQLIDLQLSTDFNYLSSIKDNDREFSQMLNIKGAEGFSKIFTLKIDGKPLIQNPDALGIDASRIISSGDSLGDSAVINNKKLEIFMRDSSNKLVKWADNNEPIFGPGKHNLQMQVHINVDTTTVIESKVLYFDFVVASETEEQTFLLYASDLNEEYDQNEKIKLSGNQYSQINYSIGLYTTQTRSVPVKYLYQVQREVQEVDIYGQPMFDGNGDPIMTTKMETINDTTHALSNGEIDEIKYTLRESGLIYLTVTAYDSFDNPINSIEIEINSKEIEDVVIGEITDDNIFKYSAENRSNTDPTREIWQNTSKAFGSQYPISGVLSDNISFNKLNGWDGESLTLRNGATITFPFNLFNMPISGTNEISTTGFTFEIDFETFNVQDDNATIMDFSERDADGYLKYNSFISIKATSAEMGSNNGSKIKTNFKESERIKIAFIVNPLKNTNNNQYDPDNEETDDNPNTMFIMVNGVLDRVVKYGSGRAGSDSFKWAYPTGPSANSFTIGNTDGKAAVKLYSIRIYDKALTLDEEFMNYMNDQSGETLTEVFEKNNVLENNEISFNLVKNLMPTMVMGIDYVSFGSFTATDKKSNTFAEVQFFDPTMEDGSLNFYARQCWVSCQGTSSMSYPVKNLRLYFCKGYTQYKEGKGGTFQKINRLKYEDSDTPVEITDNAILPIMPEYETEFWPYSEYKREYADTLLIGTTNMDNYLPYAVNKKVDGPEGSAILVKGEYESAIHDGYHKIGANRTMKGKIAMLKTYLGIQELDPTSINEETLEVSKKQITLYMVDPQKSYKTVKDAFDNTYNVYSTSGMDCYLKTEDGWSDYLTGDTEFSYDAFTHKWTKADGEEIELTDYLNSIKNDNELLEQFLSENDLFISAYRPLLHTGESLNDASYEKYIDELRYSGVKLYYWNGKKFKAYKGSLNTLIEGNDYKNTPLCNSGKTWHNQLFYSLGANWRQYDLEDGSKAGYKGKHVSGWTDRWTLKADYAESSNTHNGGVGRLWGNALYNVNLNNKPVCRTEAQKFVKNNIDIRTSCDCKPMVLFYKQIQYFDEVSGLPVYSDDIKFAGIYNIMTDKSSTKLFGFEEITNPSGTKWSKESPEYNGSHTECWECLNNGSDIIKGLSTAFDEKDANGEAVSGLASKKSKIGESRPLWGTYESRWPDTGQERHEYNPVSNPLGNNWPDDVYGVDTKNLEGFLRWVNFCKTAVNYRIGENQEMDGYSATIYLQVSNNDAQDHYDRYIAAKAIYEDPESTNAEKDTAMKDMELHMLYKKWNISGNDNYSALGETYEYIGPDPENPGKTTTLTAEVTFVINANTVWYIYNHDINMEVVTKTVNTAKIGHKIYTVGIPSFDSKYRCTNPDGTFNEEESRKHYVRTYVWPSGTGDYKYYDNFGDEAILSTAEASKYDLDPDNEHKITLSEGSEPVSCQNITYMQYFSATKRDHLDLEKVAAYYIYLLRFGGVDQVVKNSMMTTEDGQHYYFINYDNDTILGVRNDGYLIYNWDIDRNTYDASLPGYAFAGAQSVLWNCLEMDEDFMRLVQEIDQAMNKQGLLSAEAVLAWFNERQEGSWCQRLYNEQEKVKYLSTVKKDFTTDRYLGFMQGTRHSHRNWWINHRWDLYDAKWSSGMYSLKQMKFIITLSAGDNNPKDLMITTAASKYFFTMIRNTARPYADWFKELNREETGVFTIRQSNSVGDPIYLYGPQKLKVLNLRPNASSISLMNLAETYTIVLGDGSKKTSDWIDDDGAMMTKLLIGYDNEHNSSTATDISGLKKIYSLEEIDIRGMKNLNGGVPDISSLANLHRWRAKNSNATTFIPAGGVTLYEVSLGNDVNTIELDRVEFRSDPNPYESYQDKAVSGNTSIGTTLGTRYGDILPQYTSINAYKYCKSYVYDEEQESYVMKENYWNILDEGGNPTSNYSGDYVFDYAPTSKLSRVVFNNVKGIDTFLFLTDLKNAIRTSSSTANTKQYTVNINGFEWALGGENPVQDFIDMHQTFNYNDDEGKEQFTGTVYFDKQLTQEEYNKLIAEFGEDVFRPGNALTVNCKAGVLVNVKGGEAKEFNTPATGRITAYNTVQDTKLEILASIFPMKENDKYVYLLKTMTGWQYAPEIVPSGTAGKEVYTVCNGSLIYGKLTNNNGSATFWMDPEYPVGLEDGQFFEVHVYPYNADGSIDRNHEVEEALTYVKVEELVMPESNDIIVVDHTNDDTQVSFFGAPVSSMSSISDNEEHEFVIKYNGLVPNIDVKNVEISFSNSDNLYEYIRINSNNESKLAASFIPYENGSYVDINNDDFEYSFKIKHDIAQFIADNKIKVYIKITMMNDTEFNLILHYLVNCVYANAMTFYELNGTELGNEVSINKAFEFTDLGTYRYKIVYKNNNTIVVPNVDYTLEIYDNPNVHGCTVEIVDNDILQVTVNVTETRHVDDRVINIKATPDPDVVAPGYIAEFNASRQFTVFVSYPDYIEMSCTNYDLLTDNNPYYADSNLKTYSNPLAINITNNFALNNVDLDLKAVSKFGDTHPVTMSYAIEGVDIVLRDTNDAYTKSIAYKEYDSSETPDANGYIYGDVISGFSIDPITFTPIYEVVELDGVHMLSLVKLRMNCDAVANAVYNLTMAISCKLRYDNDNNTINPNGESPYFDFVVDDSTTQKVTFTLPLTRSKCVATTYHKLPLVNMDEVIVDTTTYSYGYRFYVVDIYNRFFSITAKKKKNEDEYDIEPSFTKTDVPNLFVIGCGFNVGDVVEQDEEIVVTEKHPIFVSFKQFIGYSVGYYSSDPHNEEFNIGPYASTEGQACSNTGLYNGHTITSLFADKTFPGTRYNEHRGSIFDKVFNKNTGYSMKLYVPSIAELNEIINYDTVAGVDIVPSEISKALDAVMAYLIRNRYAEVEKDYNPSFYNAAAVEGFNNATTGFPMNLVDVTKIMRIFGGIQSSELQFISSTNFWGATVGYEYQTLEVCTLQCTYNINNDPKYNLLPSSVRRFDNHNGTLEDGRNVTIPFVNVK